MNILCGEKAIVRRALSATVIVATFLQVSASGDELPDLNTVRSVVNSHFAKQPDYQAGDLISQGDVGPIFEDLERRGWTVADQKEILEQILPNNHCVVQSLRTRKGRTFMRKVSGYTVIYDRLDRISSEYGGKKMVRDLVRLPDAERYAKFPPSRGVPDLVDLLPKRGNGRRPRIKEYDKPSGKIYTEDDLLKRLEESHQKAQKEKKGP